MGRDTALTAVVSLKIGAGLTISLSENYLTITAGPKKILTATIEQQIVHNVCRVNKSLL